MHKDAKISEQNFAEPPENGVLLNVSNVECGIEDNDQSDSNMDIDSGPVDLMRMKKLAYRCQQTWEPNNFLYKDAKISEQNLAKPPENGVLLNVSKVECGIEDNDHGHRQWTN